jgi:plastocyanin
MSQFYITLYVLLLVLFIVVPTQVAFADNGTITIPLGASNPHFDTPAQFWYSPPVLTIQKGDTVTWINSDKEIHTVTSGIGVDRGQIAQAKLEGKSDGYFDSGPFKPGQSWAFTFDKEGTFYYFCTIHPWMVGAIVVNQAIPDFATDAQGNKIDKWPVVKYTDGKQVEVDLSWEPHVILTGEKITFVFNFYDPYTSAEFMTSTPYHFTITQNGTEIFSTDDATQYTGGYKYFVFNHPGPVEFKFEKIGNTDSSVQYSTMVFENPSEVKSSVPVIQPARNLNLSSAVLILFIGPPIVALAFIVIWAKWGSKFRKKNLDKQEKRSAI